MKIDGFDEVTSRLKDLTDCGGYCKAKCPAHDDRRHSLSLTVDGDKLLVNCHAGCTFPEVVDALGIKSSAFFRSSTQGKAGGKMGSISKIYKYKDHAGQVQFEVCRFEPKAFRPRRKPRPTDPPEKVKGGYVWTLSGVVRVLYRLDEMIAAWREQPDRVTIVVEGEKDADTLWQHGFIATTNVGGAGKWQEGYNRALAGRHVVVIPDHDRVNEKTGKSPGEEHAQLVERQLKDHAASVRIVRLPLEPGMDVTDFFEMGGTAETFTQLVREGMKTGHTEPVQQAETKEERDEVIVTLTVREVVTAGEYGVVRRANQLQQAKKTGWNVTGWEYCIENACGEMAVAKALGLFWSGGISGYKVKVRKDHAHSLEAKEDEVQSANPDTKFVLVTGECPDFTIRGWMTREEIIEKVSSRDGKYQIPQSSLRLS